MLKRLTAFSVLLLCCITMMAQGASYQQAVSKFRNSVGETATVTRVIHKAALKEDKLAKGNLWMKKPGKVCISVNKGKDKLIMNGATFTMVINGKKHVTNAKTNAQFTTFEKVFESLLSGGSNGVNIDKLPGVSVSKQGGKLVVKIIPVTDKKQRGMMFSSFELTIDAQTSALKSLRMNQRKGNYTEYQFGNFQFNQKVADNLF